MFLYQQKQFSLSELIQDILTTLLYTSFTVFTSDKNGTIYMAILTCLIYICHIIRTGYITFHFEILHKYMLLWASFIFLSSIWAINSSYSIEKGMTIIELLICISLIYESYYYSDIHRLLKIIMWSGFIVSIYTIMFVGVSSLSETIDTGGRMDNNFANVNTIGMVASTSVIICIYLYCFYKKSFNVFFCIPSLYVIAASGSRKALIMLLLSFIIIFYLKIKQRNKINTSLSTILNILTSLIVFLLFFFMILQSGLFDGTIMRIDGMINSFTGKGDIDSSSELRKYYRILGWKCFFENPVLGIGIGNGRILALAKTGHDCYLHCNYAELAATGGIIGLFLYYWIYVKIVLSERKFYIKDPLAAIILLLVILNLIMDYGTVSYYSKTTYFMLMIFLLHINTLKNKSYNDNILYLS